MFIVTLPPEEFYGTEDLMLKILYMHNFKILYQFFEIQKIDNRKEYYNIYDDIQELRDLVFL